ncbi:MAG: S41 family peptidase, partial [Rubripirellula sp.]
TTSKGSAAVWYKKADGILFLQDGSPAKIDKTGKIETYSFKVPQLASRSGWLKSGFEKAWLTMRDAWYDERFANHNWDKIRRKYAAVAGQMHDTRGLGQVVELMLGELNGSHLGFYPNDESGDNKVEGWKDTTAHLGVRFKDDFQGPGLMIRDVLKDGPADRSKSRLAAGDVVLSIDGTIVDPAMDLTEILNGRLDRDIALRVKRGNRVLGKDDEEREDGEFDVVIRPISYSSARSLLYEHWLDHNRVLVEKASEGRIGYLHIRAMNMSSFYEFERQLYNVGYGRQGLVIDVRDNGGGSTTDLLLTALTQPRHAITQPRGGGQGYPQDRAVFASWSKPIIVLCNQNSYSNAEIFSHAIKTLGRGKVIGVQTAGGVVSTGSATINDVGRIRVPFRGWFLLNDGEDMERNGCLPHEVIWPNPAELPQGIDRQLDRAIESLLEEIGEIQPPKKLRYASERDAG